MAVALGYGLFEARKLLEGPQLSLSGPRDGALVAGPLVHVSGEAHNIAFLSVDGRHAYANANGHFDETFALPTGYAVIDVEAVDRFGRSAFVQRRIVVADFCPLTSDAIS